MRFSATASFSAGIALSGPGTLTLRSALFSPLLNSVTTHLHSCFSHGLWPVVVPMAVLMLEPARWRRRALVAPGASADAAKLAVEAPA